MVPHVLGVGYAYNEYEVTAGRWKEFEIEFDYAVSKRNFSSPYM